MIDEYVTLRIMFEMFKDALAFIAAVVGLGCWAYYKFWRGKRKWKITWFTLSLTASGPTY